MGKSDDRKLKAVKDSAKLLELRGWKVSQMVAACRAVSPEIMEQLKLVALDQDHPKWFEAVKLVLAYAYGLPKASVAMDVTHSQATGLNPEEAQELREIAKERLRRERELRLLPVTVEGKVSGGEGE